MSKQFPVSVLFVCLGNICRSPTAHGVFLKCLADEGLHHQVEVDSAGTAAYHIGNPPDPRSTRVAARRGYDLSPLRARAVEDTDFEHYDYILAMDKQNLNFLTAMAPVGYTGHLSLFLDFADAETVREVPDPYYTDGDKGFERVVDLIENASAGLVRHIRARHVD
ncbi:low molecular weight protein-tyrosine-phosphatase [Nitrincola sp. MINF-07-Sa-05]|uniref:low molecular weight protein-tyrosine-phosphatase n=1 Tax=Nitrincola salilacus TaxID=3400273 RepID=UPI003917CC5F